MNPNAHCVAAQISYLTKDPKFEHEKPYTFNYDTRDTIPRTNTVSETKPVSIFNFRPHQNDQSFETYGFTSTALACALTATEYNDRQARDSPQIICSTIPHL
jgi:hypothetical protein